MDSMRHLSTSLPPTASSRPRSEPTTDILSDFRAAALSVTNLYKTAAKSQDRARAAGYQDALDELLAFLDKQNLGLMDGEGWRVRQWATERLEGDVPAPKQSIDTASPTADDEDDGASATKDDDKEDERSASPETHRKPCHLTVSSTESADEDSTSPHRRVVSEPPRGDFTFQASHAYPSNHDRDNSNGMELDGICTPGHHSVSNSLSAPSSTETVRIVPRSRNSKHTHNRRTENRMPTINFNLAPGAGSKRKLPYPDFFDISGIHEGADRRDGNGGRGGKRGRHV